MMTIQITRRSLAKQYLMSVFLVCLLLSGVTVADDQLDAISFNRDIRPILSDKCFHCHGPSEESRESDLRFDLRDEAYRVITPGSSSNSELILRILSDDADSQMPPPEINKPLSPKEIKLLQQWVDQGAEWSEFWAYVAPQKHVIPQLKSNASYDNWIDQLVVSRLEQHRLTLAPPADRTTLLRRLYFDLIGLPPTPDQVDAFLADRSENAFDDVVDQLLNSKHFGERLAIYWLDLVRYADTVGYHGDQDQSISPYRDWVINAFNDNMPFDQFTREQLAGDLLVDASQAQRIATGYNRLLQTSHEGGVQPKEYSAIYAADRVRNVSLVWMGATVGCAQCHDHKYDPYTSEDFYSLSAFFADVDDEKHFKVGTNALPTKRPPELLVLSSDDQARYTETQKAIALSVAEIADAAQKIKQLPNKPNEKPTEPNIELEGLKQQLVNQKKLLSKIEARGSWTMVTEALSEPRTTRVLARGDWLDESGPIVEPAIPAFMGTLHPDATRATRLDLANWLVDPTHGSGKLTARVFANRFWYLFLGQGVSKSLDDFGGQGEAPAFPELLDNLAIEFVENRWNVKQLIRLIVTSQTYQQSSLESPERHKLDPYNQLFSHQSRSRLPAELIRDNALAIAGLLNTDSIGGKSVKPYQPAGYYRHLNFPKRKYKHHQDQRQWRRGIYTHWQRQFLHPSLKAFDAPSREECTARRPQSNTPAAALVLLNDPIFIEAARVFASRVMTETESGDFNDRLDHAFRLAMSRTPTDAEFSILKKLFDESLSEFNRDIPAAEELISIGQSDYPADILIPELAAWTILTRAILNLNETMTRN